MNGYVLDHMAARLLAGLADASLRAVALAAIGAIAVPFFRKNSAAQHTVWMAVLMGMLALPVLHPWIPATRVPVRQFRAAPLFDLSGNVQAAVRTEAASPIPESFHPHWQFYTALAYLSGAVLFFARLIFGIVVTQRLVRSALPVRAGIRESDRVRVPLTADFYRPCVILPVEWRDWPEEKLAAVVAHEGAHVRRRDLLVRLASALNKSVFWFHPLAWWLERRLALLAEHAADDAGLEASRDSESYARVLVEIASRMENGKGRLLWPVSQMNGPFLARRIRRVLETGAMTRARQLGRAFRALVWSSAALLIWFAAALQFQGAARAQAHAGYWTEGGRSDSTSPQEAARMEQLLAANPEDETTRAKLLHYFWAHKMEARRVPLILWLIDHHPESALHGYLTASLAGRGREADPLAFQDARNHWLTQVNLHPNDPRVLANVARALLGENLQEGLNLQRRAQLADPADMTAPLAAAYAMVLMSSANLDAPDHNPFRNPAIAAQIRHELLNSNDATLIGDVARNLVERSTEMELEHRRDLDLGRLRSAALGLLARAQTLEPANRAWADLAEGAGRIAASANPH